MHRYQMYYLSCYGKNWVQFNFRFITCHIYYSDTFIIPVVQKVDSAINSYPGDNAIASYYLSAG